MAKIRIVLEAEEKRELNKRLRDRTVSVRDRQRAQIILLAAAGHTHAAVGAAVDVTARDGESLVSALRQETAGLADGRTRAWSQAFAARCGGQEGAGDGDATARQPGTLELSHHGASSRYLDGQCTTPVGRQRHQAASESCCVLTRKLAQDIVETFPVRERVIALRKQRTSPSTTSALRSKRRGRPLSPAAVALKIVAGYFRAPTCRYAAV